MNLADKIQELSDRREHLFKLLQERRSLGSFDTNAPVIIEILQGMVDILGFIASEVQIKQKPKP